MTLNEQLSNMYRPYFNELIAHLRSDKLIDKVQPPFQLGLNRDKDGNIAIGDETWYTNADLKIMIFGKEVHEWGWPTLDDGAQLVSDDLVEAYEVFYSENYRDTIFQTDNDNKLSKSPFFRGMNVLMDVINEALNKLYPGKKPAFIWNEISKLSTMVGRSRKVDDSIHEYEFKYFHVIPEEIKLLKPDIVIFLTGFGKPYDEYIKKENFQIQSISPVGNISKDDVIKLDLKEVPLAYKTHHPGTTTVNGHGLNDAEKRTHYYAIRDDIAANLNKIQGLQ